VVRAISSNNTSSGKSQQPGSPKSAKSYSVKSQSVSQNGEKFEDSRRDRKMKGNLDDDDDDDDSFSYSPRKIDTNMFKIDIIPPEGHDND
jgi:hypothetical protein